jgi:hypothetical protein
MLLVVNAGLDCQVLITVAAEIIVAVVVFCVGVSHT